ncbi:carbohydrate-binding family 9-like protein [Carboxylicivirga sp. N1Y90]|uniref:carbohydrate-binding family 9-like protein n=1 Tax=Carboxylicivirga fragile TaxID=3417571 RepID=UPI003D327C2E|nr:hypothetical protein [Marinilabiliaceae bacterium N1Y90]
MNRIIAKYLGGMGRNNGDDLEKSYPIMIDNWNYPIDSEVHFDIAYDEGNIYLKYIVEESNVKAVYTNINEAVWEDSCVEFFISFGDEKYYNFEFNCIGNVLVGYGPNRDERKAIDVELIKQIRVVPSLGKQKIEIVDIKTEWTLDIQIPLAAFQFTDIKSLKGLSTHCNFYKCGDKQVVPHFLSWNPIKAEQPNFHLPQYFGEVVFE